MDDIVFFYLVTFATVVEIFCCHLPPTRSGGACEDLQRYVVERKGWCGEEPLGFVECLWGPVAYVIVHHTVTGACDTGESCAESVRKLQKEHMTEKNWPDVGYHFLIGGDGKAYAGRPWNKMGGHTKSHNRKSIGIAFLGDFQKEVPSADMLDLVPKITYCGVEKGYIHPNFLVIGHRDAYCSTCPGDALYEVIKKWPRYPDGVPLPSYTCDAKKEPPAIATTEDPTPTTLAVTTTTESTTTTTVATSTGNSEVALPVYFYLLLSKKPLACCPK